MAKFVDAKVSHSVHVANTNNYWICNCNAYIFITIAIKFCYGHCQLTGNVYAVFLQELRNSLERSKPVEGNPYAVYSTLLECSEQTKVGITILIIAEM